MPGNMLTDNNSRSCNGTFASSALPMSSISATAMQNILKEDDTDQEDGEDEDDDEDEDENEIEDDATVSY
ncbi:E3 ubiquitin-protein ligase RNF34-like [Rhagoletis pomonella]|uniref:E3 ubiquitin-protein ligase RNF34-like n=1 Tax=Rhagoletis pomonella TaxID=28610 RepID=UPI0017830797|nr:E3 ubiquitin-protein ligase RNF34-like [Rhagoletis pomonella]XP_036342187.1 E3 ubiquitin-protein ligase RNF34-like [Rhagoletis pomonella]